MKITYFIFALMVCFCTTLQGQSRADEFMKLAQDNLEKKEYTKARYLFIQSYNAYADAEDYKKAIESGTKAAFLYYRENYYKEAFDLCRQMDQFLSTVEQSKKETYHEQRFLISKERLLMYMKLKNTAQAQNQLNNLENIAKRSGSASLSDTLLYTQANYYYTFGLTDQGDACFQKLINDFRTKKEYDKVSDCYTNLISIARNAGNVSLMERTYAKYMLWTDSVKSLTTQDKLGELKIEHDKSLQTIDEKDSELSSKQYLIVTLSTFAVILIAALIFLIFVLLRFVFLNKKLKNNIEIANEHNQLKALFIQNISAQMKPTLDSLDSSAKKLGGATPILERVNALKMFSDHIQELSLLENTLMEPYETQSVNMGSFCQKIVSKIEAKAHPGVEISVDAPQLQIKANPDQLERILFHLLNNAVSHTTEGKIKLEFKRKGARLCQFIVSDSGPGISAEQKENIFKPFTTVRDLAEGDGLGLPICALIANKMNGELSIDMDYNKGCRFILVLNI